MRGRHRHSNGGRRYNAPNSTCNYRGFNRSNNGGFTHKSYLPPRRKDEIFMEAGRLAAEYLVYKGLLPPNSLPPKSNEGRVRDSDVGRGWKRGGDDYDDDRRGKKRMESDWGREDGRWVRRNRGYSDMGEEGDCASGYKRERRSGGIDGFPSRSEVTGESGLGNHGIAEDTGFNFKASSSSTKKVDNGKLPNSETGDEVKEDVQPSETEGERKVGDDVIKLCGFARTPTKSRSSLTQRSLKVDEGIMTKASNAVESSSGEPKVIQGEDPVMGSLNDSPTNQADTERKAPDESVNRHQETSQENLRENPVMDEEMVVPVEVDEEKPVGDSFIPKTETELDNKLEEEKQLLPTFFKIHDLNLIEASEITKIPNDPVPDHLQTSASSLEPGKDVSLDFGLSIGDNNNNVAEDYSRISSGDKVVQVIYLEDDSEDGNSSEPSKPKDGTVYPNSDSFVNQAEHGDLPGISVFLGSDTSHCPSVPSDINNVQPGMGLHEAEGVLNDDDSLYVSLGEIPIGFWDPPSQEYGKFY